MIVGIDPGRSPGYALCAAERNCMSTGPVAISRPQVFAVAKMWHDIHVAMTWPYDSFSVIVEGQYYQSKQRKGKSATVDSLIKLAFDAGWRAAEPAEMIQCHKIYSVKPQIWKNALWPGGATIPKQVFCNRVEANLTVDEKKMLPAAKGPRTDALDAIGLAWAAAVMGPRSLAKYEVRQFRQ